MKKLLVPTSKRKLRRGVPLAVDRSRIRRPLWVATPVVHPVFIVGTPPRGRRLAVAHWLARNAGPPEALSSAGRASFHIGQPPVVLIPAA